MPRQSRTTAAPAPAFNDAESPLSWLRTRKDKAGRPLISDVQYLAGERLRMDFERAMLARRITTNWDMAGAGGRGGNAAAELSDGAIAARQRYMTALDAVGPEPGSATWRRWISWGRSWRAFSPRSAACPPGSSRRNAC